jgi:hypothetical protein
MCLIQLHNSVMAVTSLPQSTNVLFISSANNPHQRYHIYQQIRKCVRLQSIHNLTVFFLHVLICMFISCLLTFDDPFMRWHSLKIRSQIFRTSVLTSKNDSRYEGVSIRCTHYGVIFRTLFLTG